MSEQRVNEIIAELDKIRKWRKERGNLFFEAVLEASKTIKEKYGKWYQRAIDELFKEIELMNDLVPYEELNEQKSRLETVRAKFLRNKMDVDEFVASLERGDIKSFEELKLEETEGVTKTPSLPEIPTPEGHRPKGFSAVLQALSIAEEIEDIEKSIEKISRFMTNIILLARRLS